MKRIFDDEYHQKRREIDERRRRKNGARPWDVAFPPKPEKPPMPVKPPVPSIPEGVPIIKDIVLPPKPPVNPVLAMIKDIMLEVYDLEENADWEKGVTEWIKEDFCKVLKIWKCIEDTLEANGEETDSDEIVEWFIEDFPKMLPVWVKAKEKMAKKNGKQVKAEDVM